MFGSDFVQQGGFIMYPLILFSVLVWTVALHKYVILASFTKAYKKLDAEINTAIKARRTTDFKIAFSNSPVMVRHAHEVLIEELAIDEEAFKERITRRLTEMNRHLRENLWVLGTISSSAPFLGLFGTVIGIMESFKAIGAAGKSGFSVVAAGISESLIATASGIIVAVIAVIFYNHLQTKVNAIAHDIRQKVEDTKDLLTDAKAKAGSSWQ